MPESGRTARFRSLSRDDLGPVISVLLDDLEGSTTVGVR